VTGGVDVTGVVQENVMVAARHGVGTVHHHSSARRVVTVHEASDDAATAQVNAGRY
jgi:hypothetical protein